MAFKGGEPMVKVRTLKQSSILKCPHVILVADHYREDESCKCDDPEERRMMIAEWGYKPEVSRAYRIRRVGR